MIDSHQKDLFYDAVVVSSFVAMMVATVVAKTVVTVVANLISTPVATSVATLFANSVATPVPTSAGWCGVVGLCFMTLHTLIGSICF